MLDLLHRRALLTRVGCAILAAAGATALGVNEAAASDEHGAAKARDAKIKKIEPSPEGVLFTLALASAPYPIEGGKYTDPTVLVFVPKQYRLPSNHAVDWLVHFHGHRTNAQGAITHRLREQLYESRQNAVLVVPQGPQQAHDGDFGRLMHDKGLFNLLAETLRVMTTKKASLALGECSLEAAERIDRIVLSAHSGGYLAAAACLRRGGIDVREVYLFDALYDEVAAFRDWVVEDPKRHKIVSVFVGGRPRENSLELAKALKEANISVMTADATKRPTREELIKHRAVFFECRTSHGGADWEEAQLRSCLSASCLKGTGPAKKRHDKR